eukprot:6056012-Amphidinium_carterae.1
MNNLIIKRGCAFPAAKDMPDERGRTALHHAAFRGHHAVVSTLLDMGADPRLKTTSGDTALTLADFKGHSDLVMRDKAPLLCKLSCHRFATIPKLLHT